MINEFEFYHGAAIARLLHGSNTAINFCTFDGTANASYVLNNKTGLYIKHSSKRMSPWRFSFKKEHQNEIETLRGVYGEVFVLFVCGKDGIVVLSYEELKKVLDYNYDEYEWISLARNRRQEYKVKGSDGALRCKVAKNEFPVKVLNFLLSV